VKLGSTVGQIKKMARDRWLSGGVCSFPRDVLLIVPDPLDDAGQIRGLGLVFVC